MEPDIRYVRNDGVAIAYRVVGDAARDLVLVPDFVSNLVHDWETPYWRPFYDRLAQSFRLILFDKRGTGLSDRGGAGFASLETRIDDLRAVLEEVGSTTAVVFGGAEGAQMAALYAATYPERVDALVLFNLYPGGPESTIEEFRETLSNWGTQEFADRLMAATCPTFLRSEADRHWYVNSFRLGASPEIGRELNEMYDASDIRSVLPTIRVPTLLMTRGDIGARELGESATAIPNSRYLELAGKDSWPSFTSPEIVDEIEHFVDELHTPASIESILATILFTDIVDSSLRAAELGDQSWAKLVGRHHAAVRELLRRFRGTEVDTAGDGFFATFDGPARAIHCGVAAREAVAELGLEIRVGIHTGECARVGGKPSGIAVSTGARVAGAAGPGDVLVSQTVKDLVAGSGIDFEDRGTHELKGVPGEWRLYAVNS